MRSAFGDEALPERFWDKVERTSFSECWHWVAFTNASGYGTFGFDGTVRLAHRVSYEELVGSIPEGLEIDHLCRVRNCVNPRHLEPVTTQENTARGEAGAYNKVKTHCPQGHPYSGDNLYLHTRRGRGVQRQCRECRRSAYRRWYAKKKQGTSQ